MSDDAYIEIGFAEEEVQLEFVGSDSPVVAMEVQFHDNPAHQSSLLDAELVTHSCMICQKDTGEHLTTVSRGLGTLHQQLTITGHVELAEFIELQPDIPVMLHQSCRNRLVYEASRAETVSVSGKSAEYRQTRSLTSAFSFEDMCFLCGKSVGGSKDARKVVSGEEFDKRIRSAIRERNFDDWALAVQGRMDTVIDLFAADAVYHKNCHTRFTSNLRHTPRKARRGRPPDASASQAFESLCDKLESECQNELYTLHELEEMMMELTDSKEDCTIYTRQYLKELLQKRYGNHIYFASRPGRDDVVGFSNFCELLLHDKFFTERSEGTGTEAEKIVSKASRLILAEIRESDCRRELYPTADDIAGDGTRFVSPLLHLLLQCIIHLPLKQAAIGQAIMQAARPRGSLMPLLFGISVDLEQCGVQHVHTKLSRLGFSLTPAEIRHYKHSVMQAVPVDDRSDIADVEVQQTSVMHFAADNLDHNIKTLDGLGTFHGMGIVSATVVPPGTFGVSDKCVRRLDKPMKACDATRNTCAPILSLGSISALGVHSVKLSALCSLRRPFVVPAVTNLGMLWHVGGLCSPRGLARPNWSGFMQTTCTGDSQGVSAVEMLAIIDLNPSDENCVYSSLMYVIKQAKLAHIPVPNITFDQPLYIKAVDISIKAGLDIVVRLGGFHTLMSFLGSIGHLMKGSGLEEVMGLMFGPNTIEHVMSGKAYDRAIRGHFIIHAELTELLLDFLKNPLTEDGNCSTVVIGQSHCSVDKLGGSISSEEVAALKILYEQALLNKVHVCDPSALQSNSLVKLSTSLQHLKECLCEQSRTARLWILYMKYVDLVKLFLLAERTGNWMLHLDVVHGMLGLFAATGHVNYAKSARLYLQQMVNLADTHPSLHEQFMNGYHSIRRSSRAWAGLSVDLVIEQTMMRSVKSQGGLTRGRGMHETVRDTWINTLTQCSSIRAALSQVTGSQRPTPEHVEVGRSRMQRDATDAGKVKNYLMLYSPFRFSDTDRLISLSSGVVADVDDGVNCEQADEVGYSIQMDWDDHCYGDMSLKRAQQIKTLAHISSVCGIGKDKVCIDPTNLFHRLLLVAERTSNLHECFSYELTPYPMSLFKDGQMRKPDKASLYRDFISGLTTAPLPSDVHYVVDGGYLLHKVRWHASMDMCDILPLFSTFLNRFDKAVDVIFDGYPTEASLKDPEHARRASKVTHVAPHKLIDYNSKKIGPQEPFLANIENKKAFIGILIQHLNNHQMVVHQAYSDADIMIVTVALQCAQQCNTPVAVLAEDTDIFALLLYHKTPSMQDIYFVSDAKRGRGGKMIGGKCINVTTVQTEIGADACQCMLAIHSIGGCDTTSAIFGHGKGTIFTKITKDSALRAHCLTLQSQSATIEQVCSAGTELLVSLYGGKSGSKLSDVRYETYCSLSLSRRFQPERLPPSASAARMHSMRTHLQSVIWQTLDEAHIKPTDWGWELQSNRLVPVQLDQVIAPDDILKVVRCKCKGSCSSALCSCRKHGLNCVSACSNCHGTDCSNALPSGQDSNMDIEQDDNLDATDADTEMSCVLTDDDIDFLYEEEV